MTRVHPGIPSRHPIKGDIEYQIDGQSKYAESWGPDAGWTATEKGQLKGAPGTTDPGNGSMTLVAQEAGEVRVEFETRVQSGGVVH
jgi:hypothetical protein